MSLSILENEPHLNTALIRPGEKLNALRSLFFPEVVCIPIRLKEKKPSMSKWQMANRETMTDASHLDTLEDSDLAVIHGPENKNIIAIDFDNEDAANQFILLNPGMVNNLISLSSRGPKIWFIPRGDSPDKVIKIKDGTGRDLGEVRAGKGAMTKIIGTHPDGSEYKIIQNSIRELEYSTLIWPEDWDVGSKRDEYDELCKEEGDPITSSGALNHPFWAALIVIEEPIKYDKSRAEFYTWEPDKSIYLPVTESSLMNLISEKIRGCHS